MNDNLYNLEEDKEFSSEERDLASSTAIKREATDVCDDGKGIDKELKKKQGIKSGIGYLLLFKLLSSSTETWKSVKRRQLSPEQIGKSIFFPLCLFAGLSEFMALIYNPDTTVYDCVVSCILIFISFFFGYFTSLPIISALLPKSERDKMNSVFAKSFVMLAMCTLVLFYTVYNLIPMLGPILAFSPLWTVYCIYKGARLFRVEDRYTLQLWIVLAVVTVGSPMIWDWLLEEIIPKN